MLTWDWKRTSTEWFFQHLSDFKNTGNLKSLSSGGSMVTRLKLKGIDGRAPPGVELAA
jgi:hypothetical protein